MRFYLKFDRNFYKGFQFGEIGRLFVEQTIDDLFISHYQKLLRLIVHTRFAQYFSKNFVTDCFGSFVRPPAMTDNAAFAKYMFEAFTGSFTRHFHQSQRRHFAYLGFSMILIEAFFAGNL